MTSDGPDRGPADSPDPDAEARPGDGADTGDEVDRAAGRGGVAVATEGAEEAVEATAGSGADEAGSADEPTDDEPWWRHPVQAFEDRTGWRFLPGVLYPVAVWIVWRIAHLVVTIQTAYPGANVTAIAWNYDGDRYLQILHRGYADPFANMPNTAFFPGLSWLGWPIYQLTGSNAITAHATATITGIAAFVAVWAISRAWKGEHVARRAVLLLALFPSSLFLWSFYSEGLFIAAGAGAAWADRRGKRWLALACMAVVTTTRSVGILIPAVLALARIIKERKVDRWVIAYGLAGIAGLVPVLIMMNHYTGDPFSWLGVQDDWGRSLSAPWTPIIQGFQNLFPTPETIMVPARVARNWDLYCVPIVLGAIGYAAFSRKDRFPMQTWMLGVALAIVPMFTAVLASFNRFALANWIIYPVWASALGRLPLWWRRVAWTGLTVALVITTWMMIERFSVDRFVG